MKIPKQHRKPFGYFGAVLDLEGHSISLRPLSENNQELADFALPAPIIEGQTYYAVKVTHTSGDSDKVTDGHVAYVDVFANLEIANECAKKIAVRNYLNDHFNQHTNIELPATYRDDINEYHKIDDSRWNDCFEHLSNIEVCKVVAVSPLKLYNQNKSGFNGDEIEALLSDPAIVSIAKPATKKHKP